MKMRIPEYQFFSNDEYKQRMEALRSRMEQNGVDCMLVTTPENLYYFTGLPDTGLLLVADLHRSDRGHPRARVHSTANRVLKH